jgi:hypothetical protein
MRTSKISNFVRVANRDVKRGFSGLLDAYTRLRLSWRGLIGGGLNRRRHSRTRYRGILFIIV